MNRPPPFIWTAPLTLDGRPSPAADVMVAALDRLFEPVDPVEQLAAKLGPLSNHDAGIHIRAVSKALQATDSISEELKEALRDLAFEIEILE